VQPKLYIVAGPPEAANLQFSLCLVSAWSFSAPTIARPNSIGDRTGAFLRSSITFDQAATARGGGFFTKMHYLALNDFAQHMERIKIRADRGGHSAPESVLRGIYDNSLRHLARAIREMDGIAVYDNGETDTVPRVLLQAEGGHVVYVAERRPEWLEQALVES